MRKKIRNPKVHKRVRRHMSIRNKISGVPERPRVCVFRSNTHIYAQLIDDTAGLTLAAVSSLKIDAGSLKSPEADAKGDKKKKKKKAAQGKGVLQAREVGRLIAEAAKEKGVTKVAFDRGGYLYHGRVAALADAARENGLEF